MKDAQLHKDFEELFNHERSWIEKLNGSKILVTGATGLIGSSIGKTILFYNEEYGGNIDLICHVRNMDKARDVYSDFLDSKHLAFCVGNIGDNIEYEGDVDYIVHCACPTSSAYFAAHPVETIETIYMGTKYVLEFAHKKAVQGIVFLSSMEVYGESKTRKKLSETDLGYIDITSPRSSYPEGKRLAETLCCAYAKEYGVPVTIARLAQTFGPGVDRMDGRVFAYMARCALAGENIRLNTDGSKENMYLYTMDAVSAILLLLMKGERGSIYNTANEATYCSIREMAELVAKTLGGDGVGVEVNVGQKDDKTYRPDGYLWLEVSKLRELGWSARTDLAEMYRRTTEGL